MATDFFTSNARMEGDDVDHAGQQQTDTVTTTFRWELLLRQHAATPTPPRSART